MTDHFSVRILLFFLTFCLSGYSALVQAEDGKLDPSRVKWHSLNYKSYVVFFSMNVKVQLKPISQAATSTALLTPPKGQGTMPRMDPSYRIDLNSKLLGRKSFISLWFDPDGKAFQRTQTDTGSKQRVKTYRILDNGYYSHETKPKQNETELPPGKWTQVGEGNKTFSKMPPGGSIVSEPTALYYLVSASSLDKPGDIFEKYIFTKHGIYQLRLHAVDYQEIETDYNRVQHDQKQPVQGEHKTLHITMNATPLDPAGANDFDFLGLKGDIHLYMEPSTRVLLQISGKADIIGRTDIKLKEVVF